MSGQMPWQQWVRNGQLASTQSDVADLDLDLDLELTCDPHVCLVASAPASPEALLAGVSIGALAAVLAVFACGYGPGDVVRGLGPSALFICVWISSTCVLTRDTGSVLVVMRRGFMLGALQWGVLAAQWAGVQAAQAGTGIGTGAASPAVDPWPSVLMRDASIVFVGLCLVGFLLCWLCTRSPYAELKSNRP